MNEESIFHRSGLVKKLSFQKPLLAQNNEFSVYLLDNTLPMIFPKICQNITVTGVPWICREHLLCGL